MDNQNTTTPERIARRDERTPQNVIVTGDEQNPIHRKDGTHIQWHTTDTMATQYGCEIALTKFDRTVPIHTGKRKRRSFTYDRKKEKNQKNLKRAQQKIRRLVMQNYPLTPEKYKAPSFLTLTYEDEERAHPRNRYKHIQDVQEFFRHLRERYGREIKYIQVFEIQPKRLKRTGNPCVHVHAIIFNLPYNDYETVFSFWKHGKPNAQELKRLKTGYKASSYQSEKIAGYITKFTNYITKELDDITGYYEKTYMPSKYLEKPNTFTKAYHVDFVMKQAVEDGLLPAYKSEPFYCPHYQAWATYEIWKPT